MKKLFATTTLIFWGLSMYAQVMVKNIKTAEKKSSLDFNPPKFTNVNGILYFNAVGDDPSTRGLWRSDGTEAGTVFIMEKNSLMYIANDNNAMYFFSQGGLWRYETKVNSGTSNKEKEPEKEKSGFGKKLGSKLLEGVTVNNEPLKEKSGSSTEGSSSASNIPGMKAIKVQCRPAKNDANPGYIVNVNSTLYFLLDDDRANKPAQLWKSDRTEKGTTNIGITGIDISTNFLIEFKGVLYFTGADKDHGVELWKTDGTPAGTIMVKDINKVYTSTGGTEGSSPWNLINVNGTLFFFADDGVHGRELWKTDGTEAGTTMVKDIRAKDGGSSNSSLDESVIKYETVNLAAVNGTLFFTIGSFLWKSDGTEKGTVMVKDLKQGKKQKDGTIYYNQGAGSSMYLTNVNGTLFFSLSDGLDGPELWKSNGTAAGTIMVKDINTASTNGSYPQFLINANGILYFTADDGIHGPELWKSDGTAAGTVMVMDIKPFGNFGSEPKDLIYIPETKTLFFSADDGPNGRELWKYEIK